MARLQGMTFQEEKKKAQVFWNELIDFVKKQKVPYTLTSIAPNWSYITAVWVAKIDLAD